MAIDKETLGTRLGYGVVMDLVTRICNFASKLFLARRIYINKKKKRNFKSSLEEILILNRSKCFSYNRPSILRDPRIKV